jgi:hypothetical protein
MVQVAMRDDIQELMMHGVSPILIGPKSAGDWPKLTPLSVRVAPGTHITGMIEVILGAQCGSAEQMWISSSWPSPSHFAFCTCFDV